MRVWTAIAFPFVFKLPKSTCLLFPGNWNKRPGCSNTNSTTPITTGPQSAIYVAQKTGGVVLLVFKRSGNFVKLAWRRGYGEKVEVKWRGFLFPFFNLCQASRVAFGIWEPETVVKSTREAVCVIFLGRWPSKQEWATSFLVPSSYFRQQKKKDRFLLFQNYINLIFSFILFWEIEN